MSADRKRVWGESYVPRHNIALRRALRVWPDSPARVLEIGCGAGRFVRTIARDRPGFEGHGCDLEPQSIARARRYGDGVRYAVASATNLPYAADSFDVVLVFDVLEHLEQPRRALEEACRVLRPGGRLHMLVPCEGQPRSAHWLMWKTGVGADLKKRHSGHVQRFSRKELLSLVGRAGLVAEDVTYSMHPCGQLRDIASYLGEEPRLTRGRWRRLAWQVPIRVFWACSYVESLLLVRVPLGAVALHVTAGKR